MVGLPEEPHWTGKTPPRGHACLCVHACVCVRVCVRVSVCGAGAGVDTVERWYFDR